MSEIIRKAAGNDITRVKAFAARSGVSTEGIRGPIDCFYMMENTDGRFMTVTGIERLEDKGLLRALVIDPETCSMADVVRFFTTIMAEARKQELKALFLMTPSPEIFEPLGFKNVANEDIPKLLKQAADDHKSATVMSHTF